MVVEKVINRKALVIGTYVKWQNQKNNNGFEQTSLALQNVSIILVQIELEWN